MKAPAGVMTRPLLLRTRYFAEPQAEARAEPNAAEDPDLRGENNAVPMHTPADLRAVSSAIGQIDAYLRLALLLSDQSWSGEHTWPLPDPYRHARRWELLRDRHVEIVSIEMSSSLLILLGLSTTILPRLGVGLVLLAERISTSAPRVSQARKDELLSAAEYDKEMEGILHGRADAFALQLMGDGYTEPRGPSLIDFLDPDSPNDSDLHDLYE
jgi:hypothetical protein